MRKLLLGLLFLSTISFGQQNRQYNQNLNDLRYSKIEYRRAAWQSLSLSIFSYGIAATGFVNPWSYQNTKNHVFTVGGIGVGLNLFAISKFVMAKKTQKQIDRYIFDNNVYPLENFKVIDPNY